MGIFGLFKKKSSEITDRIDNMESVFWFCYGSESDAITAYTWILTQIARQSYKRVNQYELLAIS